ncbi:MAG: class I SAM-dependent methyltransferase [Desulfarculus sp.]|nr:class I SAM-dependent methyltransferase [Pseudomonadota bacterium]MBV1717563.1 class I SAM-dependent methyltransferase [Desulfarculus sp.]MBU4573549.1 class I SAM-dependent methyltransferase [Pseudomonadota bacterium]MBU4598172.1 class I SAM-dependent methyltransferase [Pseudomonadota bacterium]MBV1737872.1 class I SAM-dependent methyltransferase [Desulfarculus sp.]
MFDDLQEMNCRPTPWERYTADQLWTDPWVSSQMLAYHLDGSNAIASRGSEFIGRATGWMTGRFGLGPGKRVADFGCGPGLYAQGLAKSGAAVTGVDFSPRSIAYAQEQATAQGLNIDYRCQNYLECEGEAVYDLITLIYCDLCALSPAQRARLLKIFRGLLRPGGALLLDVFSLARFRGLAESTGYEFCPGDGFWAQEPHYVFQNSFKYEPEYLALDRYTIVLPQERREIFNWLQHFTPEYLASELVAGGFERVETLGSVAGDAYDPEADDFAMVLTAA